MPIYTYQCALCGEKKEVARSYYLGDVIEPKCDRCGIEMMRVYEAPAVVYKGSGFYSTDKDKK
jgi:putative FmdB family regulatory protein